MLFLDFICVSLDQLIKNISELELDGILNSFQCRYDKDIEVFLKYKSILFDSKAKGKTFLIFDKFSLENDKFDLLAYFTIAMKVFKFPDNISNAKIRKLDGLYSKMGNQKISEIPSFLIGQLAKNDLFNSKIKGFEIIKQVTDLINVANSIVGGRTLIIECQNNKKLIDFYHKCGFDFLQVDYSDSGGMVQMVRLLGE